MLVNLLYKGFRKVCHCIRRVYDKSLCRIILKGNGYHIFFLSYQWHTLYNGSSWWEVFHWEEFHDEQWHQGESYWML